MATLTPEQRRTRERFETAISLAAPVMNLVLAAGERLARMVEPEDPEYYPPSRPGSDETPSPASPTRGTAAD
jgi:hypothetical protein